MTKKLPIYKIVPKECDFLEIAIIDEPAIEEYFLLFGKENITFEKFENKITYKELKDTALGNSKISDSKSFLGGIFEKLAEMKKIGLA